MGSALLAKNAYLGHLYRIPVGDGWRICECVGIGISTKDIDGKQIKVSTFRPLNRDKRIYIEEHSEIEYLSIDTSTAIVAKDTEVGKLYYFGHRIIRIDDKTDSNLYGIKFTDMQTKETDRIAEEARLHLCPGLQKLPYAEPVKSPNYIDEMKQIMSEVLDD